MAFNVKGELTKGGANEDDMKTSANILTAFIALIMVLVF